MSRRLPRRLSGLLILSLLAAACASDTHASDGTLRVVATVAPVTDLVRQVAGNRAEVAGLVPAGVDSHTYEPAPADAAALAGADVFIANGLFLEEPLVRLAESNLGDDAVILTLAERTIEAGQWVFDRSFPREGGVPNPHLWLSVGHAMSYVRHIAAALAQVDPEGAESYEQNAAAYLEELEALDQSISAAVASIPVAHRKLVAYHDSWAYFGPRYGIDVVSAVQPSDFAEPSAAEVRDIVEEVRAAGVPAVFGSEVFPSDVLRVIAEESGATYVGDLSDDELPGEISDPEHSYIGMMVHNVRLLVRGLGGDESLLDPVDPARR